MKKTVKQTPPIPLFKKKDALFTEGCVSFPGLSEKEPGLTMRNLMPAPAGLRVLPTMEQLSATGLPQDVRGMGAYCGRLLVLNMESGHVGFYVFNGTSFTKSFVSAATFPVDFSAEDFMGSLIYTEDGVPHVYEEHPTPKLLFFPANCCSELSGLVPSAYGAMPVTMPAFDAAAVAGGRLYGVKGQDVYVSGANGCFDWTFDQSGQPSDPLHAWAGKCTSSSESPAAVTALRSCSAGMLVFRENALQLITGKGNPYTVKEIARTGTAYPHSIAELDGDVYFLCSEGPYVLSGSRAKKLRLPEEGVEPCGAAFVSGGAYCFCAKKGSSYFIYRYDPENDLYGVSDAPGEVLSFASCAGKILAYVKTGNGNRLYRFRDSGASTAFSLILPLPGAPFPPAELEGITCRFRAISQSNALSVSVRVHNDAGVLRTKTACSFSNASGDRVARVRMRVKDVTDCALSLSGTGEFIFERAEARFRAKRGFRTKV